MLHVFELLFQDITNDNLDFVSETIDFLFQHNQIKQVKMISKLALGCGDLITRKFLWNRIKSIFFSNFSLSNYIQTTAITAIYNSKTTIGIIVINGIKIKLEINLVLLILSFVSLI